MHNLLPDDINSKWLGAARKEDLVYPDAVRKNHPFNSFII